MNEILKIVLSLSFSGSLFILILFFCKPLFKSRISRRWQYYIWLVVVARLLLPFTSEVSPVGVLFQEVEQTIIKIYTTSKVEENIVFETQQENSTAIKNDNIQRN